MLRPPRRVAIPARVLGGFRTFSLLPIRRTSHTRWYSSTPQSQSSRTLLATASFWARTALTFTLGFHIFSTYFYSLEETWGISMMPSLSASGEWVLLSKYYRRGRGVEVGDVVSFRHPLDVDMLALKRVIGLGGDFVVRDAPHRTSGDVMVQIPEGHCYVVGDNLDHSRDSRVWGPLPMALIKGKAICKISRERYGVPWPVKIGDGLQDALDDDGP